MLVLPPIGTFAVAGVGPLSFATVFAPTLFTVRFAGGVRTPVAVFPTVSIVIVTVTCCGVVPLTSAGLLARVTRVYCPPSVT